MEAGRVPPDVAARYPRLFGAVLAEKDTYQQALKVALAIVLLLGLSVLALRAAIEGLAGVVFGGLAMATALASFVNCWSFADDVADVIETSGKRLLEALSLHRDARRTHRTISADAHAAEAASIQSEYEMRGQAKALESAPLSTRGTGAIRRCSAMSGRVPRRTSGYDPESTSHGQPMRTRSGFICVSNTFQSNGHPHDR